MKKRILAALLAASMALCAGCGSQTSDDGEEHTKHQYNIKYCFHDKLCF